MRVDAQTQQISPFYVDDSTLIRLLRWSPRGDLLAILRHPANTNYLEICLLTRGGVLQSCFEDKITDHNFRERGRNYMLTWSADGRYVYFVADYDQYHWDEFNTNDWSAHLVKAEVATGQSQENLYQTQVVAHVPPPLLFWTDDLHYLLANRWNSPTNQWLSTTLDLWQNTEFTLPQTISELGNLEYCPKFSPQGHYLTAQGELNEAQSGWTIITPDGQTVRTVGSERLQQIGIEWLQCPVWQSDETAFYFLGGLQNEARLFRYGVVDDTLITVKQLFPAASEDSAVIRGYPEMPMRLDPDNAALAITFDVPESSLSEIRILTSTNEWITFGEQEPLGPVIASFIWVPPLGFEN
jgi:hypothetical protein